MIPTILRLKPLENRWQWHLRPSLAGYDASLRYGTVAPHTPRAAYDNRHSRKPKWLYTDFLPFPPRVSTNL